MKITVHSFADVDRSGKVRWTAHELGCEVEEVRMNPGDHRKADYLALNPYGQVPAAQIDGETLVESSAIARTLAERIASPALIPLGSAERSAFNEWCAIATETLEYPVVMVYLARHGVVDARHAELLEPPLRFRLGKAVGRLPQAGFLIPGQFTLADIFLAYSLRLAIQAELIGFDVVASYLEPLMARPAAQAAGFFASIEA